MSCCNFWGVRPYIDSTVIEAAFFSFAMTSKYYFSDLVNILTHEHLHISVMGASGSFCAEISKRMI